MLANRAFTGINIIGLAIGISCCLLMLMYIQHELSFDRFHQKGDRIVRVIMSYAVNGVHGNKGNFTSAKVFPAFKNNFPEVVNGVRLSPTSRLVKKNDIITNEKNFLYADSAFFDVFDFKLIRGRSNEVLKAPQSVVISEEMSRNFFGDEDPLGATLFIGSREQPFTVTGISAAVPSHSQLYFDFVASFSSLGGLNEETYFNANYTTYLLLRNKEAIASLQGKLPAFMKKELVEMSGIDIGFELEPLYNIHLHSEYDAIIPNSNIKYIYIVGLMALLVLIIACFTYVNLGTARSLERAKEVGIRKVTGAHRSQLFWQFITESTLITSFSIIISAGIVYLCIPFFNQLAGKALTADLLLHPQIICFGLLILVLISLFAGGYPAFVLSGFQPIKVLKGAFKNTQRGLQLRQSLIVFQFIISALLIIATLVVRKQFNYMQDKKLGYDREHSLVLDVDGKMLEKMDLIKDELAAIPNVLAVSNAYETPVTIRGGYSMSGSDLSREMAVIANPIDENYLKATGIELIAGSDLSKQDILDVSHNDSTDYFHFLLNESAAKALGFTPKDAIGKKMYLDEHRPGEIKGVVRDFHFTSLHSAIQPLVLFPSTYNFALIIKTSGIDLEKLITHVGDKMKMLAPHRPFEYSFMDDDYQRLYDSEKRTGKIFNVFALIALILACLGLFGLSAYSVRQRIKEIGIRKVLGANEGQIIFLLSNNFLKLVLVASLIAIPIAWLSMQKWLESFAYRVEITWWVFALAIIFSVGIAFLTVGLQALRAAILNPTKSLRTE